MTEDDFGDRMKGYEAVETHRRLNHQCPIYARIDGRSFSRFTKGMERPFDGRMTAAMIGTAKRLVEAVNARIGYTQSDEISLVWMADGEQSETFFGGKVQKIASVLASLATAAFGIELERHFGEEAAGLRAKLPHFDARVFNLPTKDEAANAILWRAMDARKNAVSMAARAHFSHKSLHGANQSEMIARLSEAGVDFESYPASFRQGTFLQRRMVRRPLFDEELARIPPCFWPTEPVMRSEVQLIEMPAFNGVANRVDVIFYGADPIPTAALGKRARMFSGGIDVTA